MGGVSPLLALCDIHASFKKAHRSAALVAASWPCRALRPPDLFCWLRDEHIACPLVNPGLCTEAHMHTRGGQVAGITPRAFAEIFRTARQARSFFG
jgi:hypothetical protein